MTDQQRGRGASERTAVRRRSTPAARKQLETEVGSEAASTAPADAADAHGSLARMLPADVAVIEEAVTTTNTTFERLGALKNTTGYFGHRGWALGWGLGLRDRREAGLARSAGAGPARRRRGAVRHSRPVVRGPVSHARDVRDLQQRPVSDSQGRRRQHGPARGAEAGKFEGFDLTVAGDRLRWHCRGRWASRPTRVTEPDELERARGAVASRRASAIVRECRSLGEVPGTVELLKCGVQRFSADEGQIGKIRRFA